MDERFSLEQIREYWNRQAVEHGQSPSASWSDRPAMEMEVRTLLKYLDDRDSVLDVGCGNGWSTVQFAASKRISIRGIDYTPAMIEEANRRLEASRPDLKGDVEFEIGDILDLKEPDASYDKVIAVRVLINLREWDHQVRALRQCARVLRPGGVLLLSEATIQGWNRLNSFRREWGMSDIPMPPFNAYLDQQRVAGAAAPDLELVEVVDFASTYFIATRVWKPILAQLLGGRSDVASPDMEWNRFWSLAPPVGDYGTQKLFVFRKL